MHSGVYAFRDRKQNKRNFRKLWTTRINAGCRENGISYSKFINGLNDKNYYYVSTLIADSFKTANNLTNITDLENYLKTNFYDQNEVEYSIFTEQGSYCIYDVTLKNKNGTETKSVKFVMELGDGTDFKMSFSF